MTKRERRFLRKVTKRNRHRAGGGWSLVEALECGHSHYAKQSSGQPARRYCVECDLTDERQNRKLESSST